MFLCVALAVLESSVEQAILDLPTSTSQVLGSKACATTQGSPIFLNLDRGMWVSSGGKLYTLIFNVKPGEFSISLWGVPHCWKNTAGK